MKSRHGHGFMVCALLLSAPVMFAEDIKPAFNFVYNKNEAAVLRLDELNQKSSFIASLHGEINADGVRLGGGVLSVVGKFFDAKSKSIFSLHYSKQLIGNVYLVEGMPEGRYLLTLKVEGRSIYSECVDVVDDTKCDVHISKGQSVSGIISGIPTWAIDRPFVKFGPIIVQSDKDGHFSILSHPNLGDKIVAMFRIPFPGKDWADVPPTLFEYSFATGNNFSSPVEIQIPTIESKINLNGIIELGPIANDAKFMPAVVNCPIKVSSTDTENGLSEICYPDAAGNFKVWGLVPGNYSLEPMGLPTDVPLSFPKQKIRIGDSAGEVRILMEVSTIRKN